MCSGTLGKIDSNGKHKSLDGLRVRVTHIGPWKLVIEVLHTEGMFSRGDSFYVDREHFVSDAK